MNDITIFNHLGNDIRVMTDEQGEPLFVLKDICDALNLGNTSRRSARNLILTERIDPAGKIRPQLLVTPAGQSYFAGILSA